MIAGDLMDSRQVDDGSRYSRKILLATVGLSPQVVTETAYALMVSNDSPFIPSEIIIISTTTGAEQARERLLGTAAGIPWLERLYREYSGSCSPTIDFVTVADHAGMELDDIDSPESSAAFADKILETVRRITDDDSSILYKYSRSQGCSRAPASGSLSSVSRCQNVRFWVCRQLPEQHV